MSEASAIFLRFSAAKLRQFTDRIEECLSRMTAGQVWLRGGDSQNAAGNLVLHLCGNVRQWILSGVGGETDIRDRDAEFAARDGIPTSHLIARLRETVDAAVAVIDSVDPGRLTERVRIQGYDVTVLEAVYHVVEHFGQHTAQIVFAAKLFTGQDLGFYRHLRGGDAHSETIP